jgi:hypothetical protein
VEICSGHVVPLLTAGSKGLNAAEEMAEKIERRLPVVALANLADAFQAELFVMKVAGIGETIRAKQDGISRLQSDGKFVVLDRRKQSWRETRHMQHGDIVPAQKKGSRHARADNTHLRQAGIEQGVLDSGVAAGNAPKQQALIQRGKHTTRGLAGFVYAAKGTNGEGRVERGREAFAGHISDVEANRAIAQREIIQVVPSDFGHRLKFMRNGDAPCAKRTRGKHDVLDDASLFEFLFTKLFDGTQFEREQGGIHEPVRRGENGPREERRQGKHSREIGGAEGCPKGLLPIMLLAREAACLGRALEENEIMRSLAYLLVALGVGYFLYQYSLKKLPTSDAGTAATQAISLTGVRSDLLQIAQAERTNIALNSSCSSVDDMISSGSLRMVQAGRAGYTYEVKCMGGAEFQVVARHAPAPAGSSIRYPTLAIDSTMQLQEIQ